MSSEVNEVLARRWMAVWNEGEVSKLEDFYAPGYVYHMPFPGQEPGLAGEKQFVQMLHIGFPDLRISIDDLIADEHSAVVRWTITGTHQGTFAGTQPTGQPVLITGIDIIHIEHGKIVARWDEVNRHGFGQGSG